MMIFYVVLNKRKGVFSGMKFVLTSSKTKNKLSTNLKFLEIISEV